MKVLKLAVAAGLSAALIGGVVGPAQAKGHKNPNAATVATYQAKLATYTAAKAALAADPTNKTLKKAEKKARIAAVNEYRSAKQNIAKTFKAAVATAKKNFKATSKTVADRATRDAAIAQASADRDGALLQLGNPPAR